MTSDLARGPAPTTDLTERAGVDPGELLPPSCLFWVALFLVTLSPGGPEEGGWWFDSGEVVTDPSLYARLGSHLAAFPTEEQAYAHCARMNERIGILNEGRRPKSSVRSEGE